MARPRARIPLNVFVNGRLVGILRREVSGAIEFTYAQDWLSFRGTFPISLSLPLREDRYVGAPVVNVFDNLLPDTPDIRRRVAERVGATGIDAFSLLSALGRDCVGALQLLPAGVAPGPVGAIAAEPLTEDAVASILVNLAGAPLGLGPDESFRISIAGAQEKTALLRRDDQWFKPIGSTATTHIIKPQIGRLPNGSDLSNSVENEYLCLKLLAAMGVPTATATIADFGETRALVVERFDRYWTSAERLLRLPQEDCCQALSVPPTRKYQAEGGPGIGDIVDLLSGSDRSADVATFLRANIIFWLIGATDGHAKNFSVFLGPGGSYGLAPLYDVLSAQPSLDARQIKRKSFKLAMSVGKNRHYVVDEIAPRHFVETATAAGVGAPIMRSLFAALAADAVRQVESVISTLPKGFPELLVTSVTSAIERRARLLDGADLRA